MPKITNTSSGKDTWDVPILQENGDDYINWKLKVRKWVKVTTLRKSYQAVKLQLKLGQTAFDMTKDITEDVLASSTGIDSIFEALDALYLPDKLQYRRQLLRKLRRMSRGEDEPVIDFVQKFMSVYHDYKRESDVIKYPDSVLAMDLLDACNLSEEDDKIVSAQMTDPPDSSNLKTILKRVYSKEKTGKQQATQQVTTESTEKEDGHLLFARSKYNGRGTYRQPAGERSESSSRGPYRQRRDERSERGRPYQRDERSERGNPYQRNPMGRVKNVLGPDGRPKRCSICHSEYHFWKGCDRKDFDRDHEVNFSY